MTIKERALANPACAAPIAARDLDAIAAVLNAEGTTEVRSRFVTARTILAECGALGPSILDALEGAAVNISTVKWALTFLSQDSGIDVGNPATQLMLDQLASVNALTGEQAAAVKALALQPVIVDRLAVEAALFKDAA